MRGHTMRPTHPVPAGAANRRVSVPTPGAQQLLRLQRGAGNAAVTGLVVQRDDKKLLTSAQAATAVTFYRSRPDLYTADVIKQIQELVKTPATGIPDAAMAQGVAREQENQGGKVKVDGMAGPRTLPRLFPTGLATEKSATTFVAEGDAFAKAWDALGTPEKRAEDLVKRIQPLIGEVPTITPKADTIADGSVGKFQAKAWTMLVEKSLLIGPAPDEARTERITSTIYHEARHAEQHFAMARARATQLRGGSTDVVAGLENEMEIPHAIAEKAAAAPPMPPGVEFATAVQQYESVYGAGRAKHKAIEEAAPTTEQLEQARKAAAADPTPANKAEHVRLLAAFRAYHDLPTENDAFATESDYELAWDTAHAPPPPGP